MPLRSHLYLLYLSTTCWTWFFLAGLWTNYYQDLTFINAFVFVMLLPAVILLFAGKGLLKSITKSNYFKVSITVASYFAFVLLLYDFIYLKLYLNKGFEYFIDYWYLTFFSPIPFLILLPIGYSLNSKGS